MSRPDLTELVTNHLAADILQAPADALERELQNKTNDTEYALKRQATIQGLRELAEHESSW